MKHLSIPDTQLVNTGGKDLSYDCGMSEIHERLKARREAARLSQGQVVEYEGISKSYLSKLEGGQNTPNVWPLLARLAKRYKTSTDYLLGLTDNPAPSSRREMPAQFVGLWEIYQRLDDSDRFRLLMQTRLIDDDLHGIINEVANELMERMAAQAAANGGEEQAKEIRKLLELSKAAAATGDPASAFRLLANFHNRQERAKEAKGE